PPVTMIPICATRLAMARPQVRRSTRPSREREGPGVAVAGGVADAGRGLVEVTPPGYVAAPRGAGWDGRHCSRAPRHAATAAGDAPTGCPRSGLPWGA